MGAICGKGTADSSEASGFSPDYDLVLALVRFTFLCLFKLSLSLFFVIIFVSYNLTKDFLKTLCGMLPFVHLRGLRVAQ